MIVQVAVRLVEQERGLELQIIFPESTFATILPSVIAIEAESVLRIPLFTVTVEVNVSEPVRDLKSEFFSARLAAEDNESVSDLTRP
ncbi:MAG TPA: hypothetical protein VGS11_02495 [Candidatus Bathyarchaeia archaeon]|nr:hypothetical protein [Candidatus Bathyarchaeia archaeon]